jgi:hypothetical protein
MSVTDLSVSFDGAEGKWSFIRSIEAEVVLEELAHFFEWLVFDYVESFNGIFLRFPLFFGVYSRPSHMWSRLLNGRRKHHRRSQSFLHDGTVHDEILQCGY